jgi:hypothetical protein
MGYREATVRQGNAADTITPSALVVNVRAFTIALLEPYRFTAFMACS